MARRRLTQEEIEASSNKEWTKTPVFSSDEKLANRAKNLTGPKTAEGKAKSLQNLRVGSNKGEAGKMSHGGYIKRILDEDEQELYLSRKEVWLNDFNDFNESSDGLTLHLILMDEVILYRLLRRQFENPSLDIERPLGECNTRLGKNIDALGAQRKQRMKQDEKLTAISIATIAQQFSLEANKIQDQLREQEEEEKQFLINKMQRERSLTVDASFYKIEDDAEETEEAESNE